MNKYRIQVSCDVNGDYESSIVDNYEIEETSVDKAINKAEKMLSNEYNLDINNVGVDGVELLESEDEEWECEWGEPEYEIPIRI